MTPTVYRRPSVRKPPLSSIIFFGVKPRVCVRADDLNLPYRQCEYEILAPVLRAECDRKGPRPIGIREAVKFNSTGDQDANTAQIVR
jgi:hypothetical protein